MGWKGLLGFQYGIVQAPLGPDISGPDLVAAVANSGALGILRAPDWESPDYLKDLIRRTRSLTNKPFGVGVVLAYPQAQNIQAILDEKVGVLQVSWGEYPKELVHQAHMAGVKVVHQIGDVDAAMKAAEAGVDAVIVQGIEAGGHVLGKGSLLGLLPRVVEAIGSANIPVIAAGGIVDGRGCVAALGLGAHGVCLGTRFVCTEESNAHPLYKSMLVGFRETEYTDAFGRARWPDAPHRVLKTPFVQANGFLPANADETTQPVIGHTIIHGKRKEVRLYSGTVPNKTTEGDLEKMVMYAGEGVALISDILPASEVIKRIVSQAQLLIQGMSNSSTAESDAKV